MSIAALLPARRTARSLALAALAALATACGDDGPAAPNGAPCDVESPTGTIALGQTINGSLSTADCKVPDGSYADVYRLVIATERDAEIVMSSTAVDAYLLIVDEDGETVLAEDDDSAGGTNAGIAGTFAPGTYYVVANSASVGEMGAYQLRVE